MKKLRGYGLKDLPGVAILVGIAVVVMSFMGQMLADIQSNQTSGSVAYNITQKGLEGMQNFGNNIPLIVSAVVIAVVVGIILVYLGGLGRRAE